ncbi:hypothetical protein HRbin15_00104 [bacterium HR15]|uniref:Dockerin domain-containing protein n=1 Tax=uncultured prokaryote TaxID=198431 RepID=H5SN67_9ZZZZ|nr:hypothetical protein HGMM_F51E10C15 [uncultured prokaryote]GBC91650.1 hypothetical protein HRbin15_00104 [bacterium HR15]
MRRTGLLLMLTMLLQGIQAQSVLWSRLYLQTGSRGCFPQVAATDSEGNLLIAARYIMDAGHFAVVLLKYSPQGDLLWARTISQSGQSHYAEAIAVAPDNSFYVALTRANTDSLAYVQRWSADGTMLWSAEVNLSTYDVIRQLWARASGVEVLHAYGNGGIGYARLIYDANGNLLAQHLFPFPQTLTQNRSPVGMLRLNATTTLLIARVPDPDGILQPWENTLLQWLSDTGVVQQELLLPFRVERYAQASDGSLYLLGSRWEAGPQQARLQFARLAPEGTLLWERTLDSTEGDAIPDVLATLSTSWLISGNVESVGGRLTAIELGEANGTRTGGQTLNGIYRAVSGVALPINAFALLIGQLTADSERWKPFLQWWRPDGVLLGTTPLGGLSQSDEQPEWLLNAPGGGVYAISTVNQSSDNTAGIGIVRVQPPPHLSGRITLRDYLPDPTGKMAQIAFQSDSQTDVATTPLQPGGQYAVATMLSGTVQVRVYVPGWLSKRRTIALAPGATADWILTNGDANRDNRVDDADLLMVLFAFGQGGGNRPEDLNGDGSIDDADLLIVLFNFGTEGE